MPRTKKNTSYLQVCKICRRTFTKLDVYKRHLPCRKANFSASAPCARCSIKFLSKKSFVAHQRRCDLSCRHGCGHAVFRTKAHTEKHERLNDCTGGGEKFDVGRIVMVPANPYSVTEADLNEIYRPGLSNFEQQQLQATDAAVDAYIGFLKQAHPRFGAVHAAQCELFMLLGSELETDSTQKMDFAPEVEVVALPCLLRRGHWSLVVHELRSNTYTHYDSLFETASSEVKALAKTMIEAYSRFYNVPQIDEEKILFPKGCRDQAVDSQNCGLHLLHYSESLAKKKPFQRNLDMVKFRKRVRQIIIRHIGGKEG